MQGEAPRCGLHLRHPYLGQQKVLIHEHRNHRGFGHQSMQQRESLRRQCAADDRAESGDVAARPV
jgi:hypothetical protein